MQTKSSAAPGTPGKLVIVLGMHRSGTSATTRALVALGGRLGNRLLAPIAGNNDKGFFEDVDVLQLNIELLKAAGADWYTIGAPDLSRIDPLLLDRLQQRAVALLRAKCRGGMFALKDPRLCRLLPFWQPVFDALGSEIRYVIAVRNPISVAQSLLKRDRFNEEQSYLLWLAHVVPALIHTRDAVRTLVDYDRLLDDPATQLRRMASELQLAVDDAQVEAFRLEFVEEGLRHTRFELRDVDALRSAPVAMKRLYAELDRACLIGAPDSGFEPAVEAGRQLLADLEPLLRHEIRVRQQMEQQQAAIVQRDQQIQALTETVANRDRRIALLERAVLDPQRGAAGATAGAAPTAPIAPLAPKAIGNERRVLFSLAVDAARSAYQGYHLVRSLIEHASAPAADIHVHFAPDVAQTTRDLFGTMGCTLHETQPSGDGLHGGKAAQLSRLREFDFTQVVLLDAAMIAVDDIRPYLVDDALMAKMVDLPSPPLNVLEAIAASAGLSKLPQQVPADAVMSLTYAANCNNGFYSVPKALAQRVDEQWRHWTLWLRNNRTLLEANGNGYEHQIEQVAMWLAILAGGIPFRAAPSNASYYVHFDGMHQYFDDRSGIALLRYHDQCLDEKGLVQPSAQLDDRARAAVAKANAQISLALGYTASATGESAHAAQRDHHAASTEAQRAEPATSL
ncbi:MAG TPA: hypothetical protein VGG24_14465 [Paraburkholderia sp.]|jgi:hypothetical protein